MSEKNILGLTSIRGIAALSVMFLHIHDTYRDLYFFNLFSNGSLGVDLFFILSGFIMAYVYKSNFSCNKSFWFFYRNFIVARLARIYPLHLVTLLTMLLVVVVSGFYERYEKYLTVEGFIYNILLIQNWGMINISWNTVSWSISAEFFMYLVFPFMLLIFNKFSAFEKYGFFIIFMLISLQLITSYLLGWKGFGGMSLGGMVRVMFEFTIGFVAFSVKEQYKNLVFNRFKNISILLGLVLLLSLYFKDLWVIFIPVVTMFILHISIDECSVSRFLSKKYFVILGNLSFSLYMWHWIIIQVQNLARSKGIITIDSNLDMYISCIAMSLISLIVAYFSYKFIEKPARHHSKKWLFQAI